MRKVTCTRIHIYSYIYKYTHISSSAGIRLNMLFTTTKTNPRRCWQQIDRREKIGRLIDGQTGRENIDYIDGRMDDGERERQGGIDG